MENLETEYYELKLSQCESKEEYEQLVREHQSLYVDWSTHLRPLLRAKRLNYKKIAEGCEVSEASARSFIKKIPAKRENVIMLAMMMRMSVEKTNELLMRWAKFQKLYSRNPNDAIWIFLLEKGGSDEPRALFRKYYAEYEKVREEYKREQGQNMELPGPMDTKILFEVIVDEASRSEANYQEEVDSRFTELMRNSMASFEKGYQKLLDYIDGFFYDPEEQDNLRLQLDVPKAAKDRNTPNKEFQNDKVWKDAYYRKIRALEKNQIMPCRAFLIALGLRLGMDTDQLNKLLDLAGMGPLCPKDRLEGTVVFYLEDLSCNFPSFFNKPQDISISEEYELMDYSASFEAERRKRNADARDVFDVPNIAVDFEDNPVECLNDYIKRSVLGTDIFEFGYDDYILELLHML